MLAQCDGFFSAPVIWSDGIKDVNRQQGNLEKHAESVCS